MGRPRLGRITNTNPLEQIPQGYATRTIKLLLGINQLVFAQNQHIAQVADLTGLDHAAGDTQTALPAPLLEVQQKLLDEFVSDCPLGLLFAESLTAQAAADGAGEALHFDSVGDCDGLVFYIL